MLHFVKYYYFCRYPYFSILVLIYFCLMNGHTTVSTRNNSCEFFATDTIYLQYLQRYVTKPIFSFKILTLKLLNSPGVYFYSLHQSALNFRNQNKYQSIRLTAHFVFFKTPKYLRETDNCSQDCCKMISRSLER